MPARRNTAEFYDAKDKKPAGKREGTLKLGALEPAGQRGGAFRLGFVMLGALVSVGLVVLGLARRRGTQLQRSGRANVDQTLFLPSRMLYVGRCDRSGLWNAQFSSEPRTGRFAATRFLLPGHVSFHELRNLVVDTYPVQTQTCSPAASPGR